MEKNKSNHFRELLEKQKYTKEKLLEAVENTELDPNMRNAQSELSVLDNHPADIASEVFSVEHTMGRSAMYQNDLKSVEDAIQKIEGGSFGFCELCKKAIEEDRLEILPETKLCIECALEKDEAIKTARTAIKSRPIGAKNEVLTPFGKKNVGDPLSEGHKGMDILMDVLEYGSSESEINKK